jgi:hypothetical protein
MVNRSKTGPIRWTINHAAQEFEINRRTLATYIAAAGLIPGDDHRFSTKQIMTAVIGDVKTDLKTERLKKLKAEAALIELKTCIIRKDFHPAVECERILTDVFTVMRQEICASDVPIFTRDSLLSHLRQLSEVDWQKL